jgi:hypothetical protein
MIIYNTFFITEIAIHENVRYSFNLLAIFDGVTFGLVVNSAIVSPFMSSIILAAQ